MPYARIAITLPKDLVAAADRRAQLERDLARSPAERLRSAEAAARTARAHRAPRGRRHQIIGFDSYDDFYEWKQSHR